MRDDGLYTKKGWKGCWLGWATAWYAAHKRNSLRRSSFYLDPQIATYVKCHIIAKERRVRDFTNTTFFSKYDELPSLQERKGGCIRVNIVWCGQRSKQQLTSSDFYYQYFPQNAHPCVARNTNMPRQKKKPNNHHQAGCNPPPGGSVRLCISISIWSQPRILKQVILLIVVTLYCFLFCFLYNFDC